MTHWYISFASPAGFLGATVVKAISARGAIAEAKRRGVHPGGEAAVLEVQPGDVNDPDVRAMLNRLVNARGMQSLGAMRVADCPAAIRESFYADAEHFCEHHGPRRH